MMFRLSCNRDDELVAASKSCGRGKGAGGPEVSEPPRIVLSPSGLNSRQLVKGLTYKGMNLDISDP